MGDHTQTIFSTSIVWSCLTLFDKRGRTALDSVLLASCSIRFSWNVWPNSRLEATRIAVPLGTLYTVTSRRRRSEPEPRTRSPCSVSRYPLLEPAHWHRCVRD